MRKNKNILNNMDSNLKDYYQQMKPLIKEGISEVIPIACSDSWLERISGKPRYKWNESIISKALLEPINLYIERSDILLRPLLQCISLQAFNKDPKDFRASLGASELMRIAGLIIDDLVSHIPSGYTPSIYRLYSKSIAGNTGEGLLAIISYIFFKNVFNLDKETLLRCYKALTKDGLTTGIGIGMELIWRDNGTWDIPEDIFFQYIIDRKENTNFRSHLKMGALIADAPDDQVKALASFGELIGLAYQLRRDSLVMYSYIRGAEEVRNNWTKDDWRIFPVIHTVSKATSEDKNDLLKIINLNGKEDRLINKAIGIINEYKSIEYTEKKAKEFLDEGVSWLEKVKIPDEYKKLLRSFTHFVLNHPMEI